jgi:hypothetical protein
MGGSPAERAPRYVARREQSRELLETKPVGHIEGPCLEMELHEMEEIELGGEKRIQKRTSCKRVSFTDIKIRSHNIVIGDHPCCTMGFPLSLGWEYTDADSLSLDKYEAKRSPRRTRRELRTSCEERRLVVSDDLSADEIRSAQRKLHRERTSSARLCERMSDSFFQECRR